MGERSAIQIAAWAIAAVLVAAVAWRLLSPTEGGAGSARVRIDDGFPPRTSRRRPVLYVHVAGAVRRPGLYRVPPSARVAVAVEKAGGPARRADLTGVNLAQRLEDGQQIVVPAAGARAGGTEAAGGAARQQLSLATATPEQLEELDGIGPTLAERIVEYRDAHGGFRSVAELREVEGIGPKRFAALKDAVRP